MVSTRGHSWRSSRLRFFLEQVIKASNQGMSCLYTRLEMQLEIPSQQVKFWRLFRVPVQVTLASQCEGTGHLQPRYWTQRSCGQGYTIDYHQTIAPQRGNNRGCEISGLKLLQGRFKGWEVRP